MTNGGAGVRSSSHFWRFKGWQKQEGVYSGRGEWLTRDVMEGIWVTEEGLGL